jgi:hypothetical protein
MLVAARDWSHKKYGQPIGNDAAIGCFMAMIEAAPQPQDSATDEQLAAAVRAWFGDSDFPPVSKEFIERMRKAIFAARSQP